MEQIHCCLLDGYPPRRGRSNACLDQILWEGAQGPRLTQRTYIVTITWSHSSRLHQRQNHHNYRHRHVQHFTISSSTMASRGRQARYLTKASAAGGHLNTHDGLSTVPRWRPTSDSGSSTTPLVSNAPFASMITTSMSLVHSGRHFYLLSLFPVLLPDTPMSCAALALLCSSRRDQHILLIPT